MLPADFLDNIHARDDETPPADSMLILADYLEGQGDARSTIIRDYMELKDTTPAVNTEEWHTRNRAMDRMGSILPEFLEVLVKHGLMRASFNFNKEFCGLDMYWEMPASEFIECAEALAASGLVDVGLMPKIRLHSVSDSELLQLSHLPAEQKSLLGEVWVDPMTAAEFCRNPVSARMQEITDSGLSVKIPIADTGEVRLPELLADINRIKYIGFLAGDYFAEQPDIMGIVANWTEDPRNAESVPEIINMPIDTDASRMLHVAVEIGSDLTFLYARHQPDTNIRQRQGKTPLHVIDRCDHIPFLIERGGLLEARDESGYTPLHSAIQRGNEYLSVVGTLLEHGANVNARNSLGESALHLVLRYENYAVLPLLKHYGVDTEIRDHDGDTAMQQAADHYGAQDVRLLAELGADTDVMDPQGNTLLHLAVRGYCMDIDNARQSHYSAQAAEELFHLGNERVKAVLELGIDRKARNGTGQTAANIARAAGLHTLAKMVAPQWGKEADRGM